MFSPTKVNLRLKLSLTKKPPQGTGLGQITSGGFSRVTRESGATPGPPTCGYKQGPDLHGELDVLGGVQALRQVLQAVAAGGVGEGVAAPTAPRHGGVGVIRYVWQPVMMAPGVVDSPQGRGLGHLWGTSQETWQLSSGVSGSQDRQARERAPSWLGHPEDTPPPQAHGLTHTHPFSRGSLCMGPTACSRGS